MTKQVYILDLDGTLVEPFTGTQLLPNVKTKLKAINSSQTDFAIATNQGGVGMRYWMERNKFGEPDKYPRLADVLNRIETVRIEIAMLLNCNYPYVAISLAYQAKRSGNWSPVDEHYKTVINEEERIAYSAVQHWRKPDAGMLFVLQQMIGREHTYHFVGDRSEDRLAAELAGFEFHSAKEFF